MKAALPILVLVAVVSGCGDDGYNATPDPRCKSVPHAVVKKIEEGLTVTGGASLHYVQAVKSEDYKSVYFVSAHLAGHAEQGIDELATWSTNRLDPSGLIFAVDNVAQKYSDWGDGDKTDANLTMDDDGASLSKDCVRAVGHVG
jgi:hypothetical protein